MKKVDIGLIKPTVLYNILNEHSEYPRVSDPNYVILLDARIKGEFDESHIVLSKRAATDAKGTFILPYDCELECKEYVVVYDGQTSSTDQKDSRAYKLAKLLSEMGSRNPVLILEGGYEKFSAVYPFLRTQKVMWLPQELDAVKTYPYEIIPGELYLGDWRQGTMPYIQKDLKIKAHVCVDTKPDEFFTEPGPQLLQVPVNRSDEADLVVHLQAACDFIKSCRQRSEPVLVFSNLGISRAATIVIAYLVTLQKQSYSVEEAVESVKTCSRLSAPTTSFMAQLKQWTTNHLSKPVEA